MNSYHPSYRIWTDGGRCSTSKARFEVSYGAQLDNTSTEVQKFQVAKSKIGSARLDERGKSVTDASRDVTTKQGLPQFSAASLPQLVRHYALDHVAVLGRAGANASATGLCITTCIPSSAKQ